MFWIVLRSVFDILDVLDYYAYWILWIFQMYCVLEKYHIYMVVWDVMDYSELFQMYCVLDVYWIYSIVDELDVIFVVLRNSAANAAVAAIAAVFL